MSTEYRAGWRAAVDGGRMADNPHPGNVESAIRWALGFAHGLRRHGDRAAERAGAIAAGRRLSSGADPVCPYRRADLTDAWVRGYMGRLYRAA